MFSGHTTPVEMVRVPLYDPHQPVPKSLDVNIIHVLLNTIFSFCNATFIPTLYFTLALMKLNLSESGLFIYDIMIYVFLYFSSLVIFPM